MSAVKIGRVWVESPYNQSQTGQAWTFDFEISEPEAPTHDVLAKLANLAALRPGEAVPIVWRDDPRMSGYYRLTSSIALTPSSVYLTSGYAVGSITATRLSGRIGELELTLGEYTRDETTHTVTETPYFYIPATGLGVTPDPGDADEVACEYVDGQSPPGFALNGTTNALQIIDNDGEVTRRFSLPVTDHYVGAATIEARWPDGVWRPVVGSFLPSFDLAPGDVRFGNGRIRFRLGGDVGDNCLVYTSNYDPSTGGWTDEQLLFEFVQTSGSLVPVAVVIERNTVEEVALTYVDRINGEENATLSLRRGPTHATLTTSDLNRVIFYHTVADPGETYATSDDWVAVLGGTTNGTYLNGAQYVLSTETFSLASELVYTANGSLTDVEAQAIGVTPPVGAGDETSIESPDGQGALWFANVAVTQRVLAARGLR